MQQITSMANEMNERMNNFEMYIHIDEHTFLELKLWMWYDRLVWPPYNKEENNFSNRCGSLWQLFRRISRRIGIFIYTVTEKWCIQWTLKCVTSENDACHDANSARENYPPAWSERNGCEHIHVMFLVPLRMKRLFLNLRYSHLSSVVVLVDTDLEVRVRFVVKSTRV